MAKRENSNAEDSPNNFGAAMRQCQRARHDANAQRSNRGWHDEPVIPQPFAKREYTEQYREEKPNFMDNGVKQQSASRRHENQQDGGCKTVDQTQPGNAQTEPVPAPFCPYLRHYRTHVARFATRYNITYEKM